MWKELKVTVFETYFQLLQKQSRLILCLLAVLSAAGAFYSLQLYKNLRTDLEELLPESAPSVLDLKKGSNRFSGMNHLEVVIESGDSQAAEGFQIAVAERLRKLSPEIVAAVKVDIREERLFFKKYRPYFVELSDWDSILTSAHERLKKAAKKMFNLGLDDEAEEESSKSLGLPLRKLRKKYETKAGPLDRFPDDYFQSHQGHTRVVLAFLPGKVTDVGGNKRLSEAAGKIIEELNPRSYAPDMQVGLGGDVQNVVEEHRELVKDLVKSFIVVSILVTLVIFLFYGTLSLVSVLSLTIFSGVALTFGLSYFLVGYLNANTAFLGSIVIGNGVNFPIILLARYAELRRQRKDYLPVLQEAIHDSWKPTLAAALAAGVSYGSLALTDFRGFSQFGIIGAVGMVVCWLYTYTLLPALLLEGEKAGLLKFTQKNLFWQRPVSWIARFAVGHHKLLAAGTIALSLASLAGGARLSRHTIESDLSKLRNKWSMEHGSGFWGKKTDELFGRNLTPTVLLTDGRDQSRKVLEELKKIHSREGDNSPFASFSVVEDIYPAEQEEKFERMQELRSLLTPKVMQSLSSKEAALVRDFLPDPLPRPFEMRQLPDGLLKSYQESDGRLQTVVQVFPRLNPSGSGTEAHGTWNGEEVIRYTKLLREAIRSSGVNAVIIGQNPISADMLESIERDGPKATAFAFLAVAILVVLLFPKPKQALPTLMALLFGVLWMVGAIGWFNWKINFLNFIALPITFGIGVDYPVNIFSRIFREAQAGGKVDVEKVIRETGTAVVLCSLTTVIGYGSLLLSGSQAFVSFGKLAVTGEFTCIGAAILSLPSLWMIFQERRDKRRAGRGKNASRPRPEA
jgi:uncharacterized protein